MGIQGGIAKRWAGTYLVRRGGVQDSAIFRKRIIMLAHAMHHMPQIHPDIDGKWEPIRGESRCVWQASR